MKTMSLIEAQANFDSAAKLALGGEAVAITEEGRPSLLLVSCKVGEELLRLRAAATMASYLDARAQTMPKGQPDLSMDDINRIVRGS